MSIRERGLLLFQRMGNCRTGREAHLFCCLFSRSGIVFSPLFSLNTHQVLRIRKYMSKISLSRIRLGYGTLSINSEPRSTFLGEWYWSIISPDAYSSRSSNKMPAAVKAAIKKAAVSEGKLSDEEATKYISTMEWEGRLYEECWS